MILETIILLASWTKFGIASGDEKSHVHFKIHVPEITKHHIHTKTIFIHVHGPHKKPSKPDSNLESHDVDWSDYSNYDNANEYIEGKRDLLSTYNGRLTLRGGHYDHQDRNQGYITSHERLIRPIPIAPSRNNIRYPHYHRDDREPPILQYPDFQPHDRSKNERDRYIGAAKSVFSNGIIGYSYPPQYDVHENVVENSYENSDAPHTHSYEEGRNKGHRSEIGHLYTNKLNNFYDDKQEESSEVISIESKEIAENDDRKRYGYVDNHYTNKIPTIRVRKL